MGYRRIAWDLEDCCNGWKKKAMLRMRKAYKKRLKGIEHEIAWN